MHIQAASGTIRVTLQLYHYRARLYNLNLVRFCSRDPIGFEDSANLYCYVHGRCLIKLDPSGQVSEGEPRKDEKCCSDAKKDGLDEQNAGGVICCDGRAVVCIWQIGWHNPKNEKAKKIMLECATKHEELHRDKHIPECKKDSCLERMGPHEKITLARAECDSYLVHYRCLYNKITECGSDITCIKEVEAEKDTARKLWISECDKAKKEESNKPIQIK
ncbi:RHS repeat-associated core domain-containing protein [Aureliella helgolandensis]|uniref:Uncharacterized protein n=1 Tax=Aureliella helgolandensis TaxID=2527968 RepID=A0A518GBH5_9BACT|nr:RHS repeat-associated core domain-containing protein [Aureliella helgolandensis]QDV25948.1 hypothetical protein Q31a_43170 [Aureliella helgolandensis]